MSNYQILQPSLHADLTVEPSLVFANAHQQFAPICLAEIPQVAVEYPIFIAKHPKTGQFGCQAMLGLEAKENLFLQGEQWQSAYVPLHYKTQPFRLAVEQNNTNNAQISIDIEHPSVTCANGVKIFKDDQQHSELLTKTMAELRHMLASIQHNQAFFNSLLKYDLLERVQLNIHSNLPNNLSNSALYSVNEQQLNKLTTAQIGELHQTGYLPACYLILASKLKIQTLINLKQNRLQGVENA